MRFTLNFIKILFVLAFFSSKAIAIGDEGGLKSGFVNLHDYDPTIIINIKYAENENITGRPLKGITANKCILSREAAITVREVQKDLNVRGFSLVIYNAYIPEKAVYSLKEYIRNNNTVKYSDKFCPNIENTELLISNYIMRKLDHARGSTLDVSIIPINKHLLSPPIYRAKTYLNSHKFYYAYDGTLNMGTSYDVFDSLSAPDNDQLNIDEQKNRQILAQAMQKHGFKQSNNMWWQFTLIREPFMDSMFDFDI